MKNNKIQKLLSPNDNQALSDQVKKALPANERVAQKQGMIKQFVSHTQFKKTTKNNSSLSALPLIGVEQDCFTDLFSMHSFTADQVIDHHCDNLIGSVEIPVGVAGPVPTKLATVDKNGNLSSEKACEFLLPLATLEGALVASINRGCKALAQAKNCSMLVQKKGMTRAPVFGFENHLEAARFMSWLDQQEYRKKLDKLVKTVSSRLIYLGHQSWQAGRQVFVRFIFDTDQAMGMNMVTIATHQIWQEILSKQWPSARLISLSGNMCVDKKPSALNRLLGRGYLVDVEAQLSAEVIQSVLKTSAQTLFKTYYWKNVVGSGLAGSANFNMQAANAVAAIFLATGQDMAHVGECSQADLFLEVDKSNLLNISLRMPDINVGTVGGGTGFPCFVQARRMMIKENNRVVSLTGEQLAAATALAVLAGELSGLAALSVNQLAQAHQKLGRSKQQKGV